MNWIDAILLVLLLVSVIIGSKKGLIRELMAFIVFFVAIIFSVNYIDNFAVWVHEQLGGSSLVSAFLSFVVLLAISYAAFKLIGLLFYKVADLKRSGKRDQMGGALVGFLRGWVAIGFLVFLVFLLPLPNQFYSAFESSFFGPAVAKTIPLMFEGTAVVHPQSPDFMTKIERALLVAQSSGKSNGGMRDEDRVEVYQVLQQMRRFFITGFGDS
jgi:membrane protein required for colicin V production